MNEDNGSGERMFAKAIEPMLADGGGARLVRLDETRQVLEVELVRTCLYCPNNRRSAEALIVRLRELWPSLEEMIVTIHGRPAARWSRGGPVIVEQAQPRASGIAPELIRLLERRPAGVVS